MDSEKMSCTEMTLFWRNVALHNGTLWVAPKSHFYGWHQNRTVTHSGANRDPKLPQKGTTQSGGWHGSSWHGNGAVLAKCRFTQRHFMGGTKIAAKIAGTKIAAKVDTCHVGAFAGPLKIVDQ